MKQVIVALVVVMWLGACTSSSGTSAEAHKGTPAATKNSAAPLCPAGIEHRAGSRPALALEVKGGAWLFACGHLENAKSADDYKLMAGLHVYTSDSSEGAPQRVSPAYGAKDVLRVRAVPPNAIVWQEFTRVEKNTAPLPLFETKVTLNGAKPHIEERCVFTKPATLPVAVQKLMGQNDPLAGLASATDYRREDFFHDAFLAALFGHPAARTLIEQGIKDGVVQLSKDERLTLDGALQTTFKEYGRIFHKAATQGCLRSKLN